MEQSDAAAPTEAVSGGEGPQQYAALGYDTDVVSDYPPVAPAGTGTAAESTASSDEVEATMQALAATSGEEEVVVVGVPIGHASTGPHLGRGPHHVLVNERPDGSTTVLTVDPASGLATYVVLPPGATLDAPPMPGSDGDGSPSDPRVFGFAIEDLITDPELSLAWRMARTIRLYAVADLLIVAIGVILWPYFATLIVFPILGFLAAARYYFPLAVVYCVYFPLVVGVRCYLTYLLAAKAKDTAMRSVNIAIGVVGVLLEMYCARLAILFARLLYVLGPARRDEIRGGRAVLDRRFYWW